MLSVLILLVACLADLGLAAAVLLNNSKARLNRVLTMLLLVLPAWNITVFLEDTAFGHINIQGLSKVDYALATLMIVFFFWFCKEFVGLKSLLLTLIAGVFGVLNILLIFTGQTLRVQFEGANVVFEPKWGFA